MRQNLLVSVHLIHDRYHGSGEWPPAPARVFQALVAGAARGKALSEASVRALGWLEGLAAPIVAVPNRHDGQAVLLYVPNNDLDAVGGDPARVAELRVPKLVEPRLLSPGVPLFYAWSFEADADADARVPEVIELVEGLYQLGRGVDMAWARAEVLAGDALEWRLAAYPGVVHRPTPGGSDGILLSCPRPDSLASLRLRFEAFGKRFSRVGVGTKASVLFTQPPKARFVDVTYDSAFTSHLFELRHPERPSEFKVWQFHRAHDLVVAVRDGVAERLTNAFPNLAMEVQQVIIGRAGVGPATSRVRFVPLPSIGHEHADGAIRRVLVQVPSDAVFTAEDVRWAMSGLAGGKLEGCVLVPGSDDDTMLDHYGIGTEEGCRTWHSVTPVALPHQQGPEAATDNTRSVEEAQARAAVGQALRHAGWRERLVNVRVQREPFGRKGKRSESFAEGTRFGRERLWHVSIELDRPIRGPLVIGDGRYLGLGVMAMSRDAARADGIWRLEVVSGLVGRPQPETLARALRRAVMARAQAQLPPGAPLPLWFTGHEADGERAIQGHEHLAFAYDEDSRSLWIVAPHRLAHRPARGDELQWMSVLSSALVGFDELKAGSAGVVALRAIEVGNDADMIASWFTWESLTPYVVTRHTKGSSAHAALIADVRVECRRLGLPEVEVEVVEGYGRPGVGLVGMLRLRFATRVAGPLMLGRTRHLGGGVFMPA